MTDPESVPTDELRCAECDRALSATDDRVETADATFCRSCYDRLSQEVSAAVSEQGADINYGNAAVGGVLGGAIGALLWWGIAVATRYSIGIVAIAIGFTVGKGVTMFAGGKRSVGLQGLSVGITALAFFYATYLINRTYVLRAFAGEVDAPSLPLIPMPDVLFQVVAIGFSGMDLVFLGIALFQAWRMPAPFRLAR